jgi:hypothetical protein
MYFWVEIAYKISLLQQVTCCLSLKKKPKFMHIGLCLKAHMSGLFFKKTQVLGHKLGCMIFFINT